MLFKVTCKLCDLFRIFIDRGLDCQNFYNTYFHIYLVYNFIFADTYNKS